VSRRQLLAGKDVEPARGDLVLEASLPERRPQLWIPGRAGERRLDPKQDLVGRPEAGLPQDGPGAQGEIARGWPAALLGRLLHHAITISIRGHSYRLKDKLKAGLVKADEAPST
jgi:hypothetical protein